MHPYRARSTPCRIRQVSVHIEPGPLTPPLARFSTCLFLRRRWDVNSVGDPSFLTLDSAKARERHSISTCHENGIRAAGYLVEIQFGHDKLHKTVDELQHARDMECRRMRSGQARPRHPLSILISMQRYGGVGPTRDTRDSRVNVTMHERVSGSDNPRPMLMDGGCPLSGSWIVLILTSLCGGW